MRGRRRASIVLAAACVSAPLVGGLLPSSPLPLRPATVPSCRPRHAPPQARRQFDEQFDDFGRDGDWWRDWDEDTEDDRFWQDDRADYGRADWRGSVGAGWPFNSNQPKFSEGRELRGPALWLRNFYDTVVWYDLDLDGDGSVKKEAKVGSRSRDQQRARSGDGRGRARVERSPLRASPSNTLDGIGKVGWRPARWQDGLEDDGFDGGWEEWSVGEEPDAFTEVTEPPRRGASPVRQERGQDIPRPAVDTMTLMDQQAQAVQGQVDELTESLERVEEQLAVLQVTAAVWRRRLLASQQNPKGGSVARRRLLELQDQQRQGEAAIDTLESQLEERTAVLDELVRRRDGLRQQLEPSAKPELTLGVAQATADESAVGTGALVLAAVGDAPVAEQDRAASKDPGSTVVEAAELDPAEEPTAPTVDAAGGADACPSAEGGRAASSSTA